MIMHVAAPCLRLSGHFCHLKMWHSYEGLWAAGSLGLLIIHSKIQFCPLYAPAQGVCLFRETESLNTESGQLLQCKLPKGTYVCAGEGQTVAAVLLLLVLFLSIENVHYRCIQWMEDVKLWIWYLKYSIWLFLESLGMLSWRWRSSSSILWIPDATCRPPEYWNQELFSMLWS